MQTIKIITQEEKELLLNTALRGHYRDFAMIFLCLNTGLRNFELTNLLVSDVTNFESILHTLTVRPEIAKGSNTRYIPFSKPTKDMLSEFILWKENNHEPIALSSNLFVSRYTHRILSIRDFQRILRKHALDAFGRSINPHVLRHTFATDLLQYTNIRVIQNLLGHKNLNSTQVYTHPNSSDMQNAVDQLK